MGWLGSKIDSEIRVSIGGSPTNDARQFKALGCCSFNSVFLVGQDRLGVELKDELGNEYCNSTFVTYDGSSRLSVIAGDKAFTVRPKLKLNASPPAAVTAISAADYAIVGPFTRADEKLVNQLVQISKTPVIKLSRDQLEDKPACFQLIGRCLVVLNEDEARGLSGCDDTIEAIMAIRERAACDIVVTGETRIDARIDGNWYCQPCFRARAKQTSGAGDVFCATLVACLALDEPIDKALRLAAAASARHVEGLSPCNLAALEEFAAACPAMPLVHPKSRARTLASKAGAVVATSIFAAAAIGLSIWSIASFAGFENDANTHRC